jgi:hypothetical protein
MTTATRRQIRGARSLKVRPEVSPARDQVNLGSFPPPTEWSEDLAIQNQRLSRAMAMRMRNLTGMDLEPLQAVADIGLLKGCRLYDPNRINPGTGKPYSLSTCVVPYIRGAMLHYLRDKGHTSGVKFPDAWRDTAPRVRKLAGEGASLDAIAKEVGLPAPEIEAILQSQRTPAEFDPELGDPRSGAPDPLDEVEEHHELAEALAIADRAFAALHWGDQQMLINGWQMRRGPHLAPLPHGQFVFRVKRILQGLPVAAPRGRPLPPLAAADHASAQPRLTASTQIIDTAEQLGLFGAYLDQGGKTPTAEIGSASAAGDQPSDR